MYFWGHVAGSALPCNARDQLVKLRDAYLRFAHYLLRLQNYAFAQIEYDPLVQEFLRLREASEIAVVVTSRALPYYHGSAMLPVVPSYVDFKDKSVFVWDAKLRVDKKPLQGSPRYLAAIDNGS